MKRLLLGLLLLFAGCTESYRLPDGGYGFDVHIRIAPPAAIATISHTPTRLPTLTPTRTFTVAVTATNTQVAATETDDPTPTRESSATFLPDTPLSPQQGTVNGLAFPFLNVRSAPGRNNPDVGDLLVGQVVFITNETRADDGHIWYQIELAPSEDAIGWVRSDFIDLFRG
jgi:hypothetical protein